MDNEVVLGLDGLLVTDIEWINLMTTLFSRLSDPLGRPPEIAERYLSANTVKTHLRRPYRRLGAHSRHEAIATRRPSACSQRPARRRRGAG